MSLPELYELQHCLVHVADVVIAPNGKIEGKRFGTAPNSPIKYSRTEFVALIEAERLQRAEIIGKYGRQEQAK